VASKTFPIYQMGADIATEAPMGTGGYVRCGTQANTYCLRIYSGLFYGRWKFFEMRAANGAYLNVTARLEGMYTASDLSYFISIGYANFYYADGGS
jgi:hypothetical protein